MTEHEPQKPWYKHFWPWFLISIPLASVCAGIAMIIMATNGADTLVDENYYKEGLTINKHLERIEEAKRLGITAQLNFEEQLLVVQLESSEAINDNLFLNFQHNTKADKDFQLKLQQTSQGRYIAQLEGHEDIHGKWWLKLEPHSRLWELKEQVYFPSQKPIILGD